MQVHLVIQDLFGSWSNVEQEVLLQAKQALDGLQPSQDGKVHLQSLVLEVLPYQADEQDEESRIAKTKLNLFIVRCDDLETYKNHVKALIRNWHDVVTQRMPLQQWLILHVCETDPSFGSEVSGSFRTGAKLLTLKTSVLDKIRSDFNSSAKDDRCFQLRSGDSKKDMQEAHQNLARKIAALFLSSISASIEQLQTDLELNSGRSADTKQVADSSRILLNLAQLHEALTSPDEALADYDRLANIYDSGSFNEQDSAVSREALDNFLRMSASIDDQMRLFEKLANEVDIKISIFSYQAAILHKFQRFEELLHRGLNFVINIALLLRTGNSIQSCCVVILLIERIIAQTPTSSYSQKIASGKGDLLFYLRSIYLQLGTMLGLNPDNSQSTVNAKKLEIIQDQSLRGQVGSAEAWCSRLYAITEETIADYKYAGRHRSAKLLNIEIILQQQLKTPDAWSDNNTREIEQTFSDLQSWPKLGDRHNDLYLRSFLHKDETEYVTNTLDFLKEHPDEYNKSINWSEVLSNIQHLSTTIEIPMAEYFSIKLPAQPIVCSIPAGVSMVVSLQSHLPCELLIGLSVILTDPLGQEIELSTATQTCLGYGSNDISITCNISVSGLYTAKSCCVVWNQVYFRQQKIDDSAPVSICRNIGGPTLVLEEPRTYSKGGQRPIILVLDSAETDMQHLNVRVHSRQNDVSVVVRGLETGDSEYFREASSVSNETGHTNLARQSRMKIHLNLAGISDRTDHIFLEVMVKFTFMEQLYSISQRVDCAASFPIRCEWFSRVIQEELLVNGAITCEAGNAFLINDFRLQHSQDATDELRSEVLVTSKDDVNRHEPCLLTHYQSVTLLSKIKLSKVLFDTGHLRIDYTCIRDALQQHIRATAQQSSNLTSHSNETQSIMYTMLELAIEDIDETRIGSSARLHFKSSLQALWSPVISTIEAEMRARLVLCVDTILEEKLPDFLFHQSSTRTYSLPLNLSNVNQGYQHELTIKPQSQQITLGSSLPIEITLQTHFFREQVPSDQDDLTYEIALDELSWLLIGARRGTFKVSEIYCHSFALVPLRKGHLMLPGIRIKSSQGSSMSMNVISTQRDLSVLVLSDTFEHEFDM